MTVKMRDSNNLLKTVPVLRVRDGGNVVRTLKEGWARDGGNVKRQFLSLMSAVMTPATYSESKHATFSNFYFYTAVEFQLVVSNAIAPVGYRWIRVSGAADDEINVFDVFAQKSKFLGMFDVPAPASHSAVWQCTATDALGRIASATLNITMSTTD